MARTVGIVTAKAAFDMLGGKYVRLADMQALIFGNRPNAERQKWGYKGNWKKSVAPIYFAE